MIQSNQGIKVDNNEHRVNQKGYLIDNQGNIVNKQGTIIFYKNEIGYDGEIPAPFVYEKHKTDFLSKALKRKEGTSIDSNYMLEDDEELVEAELQKIRPTSKQSSVESLIADNPGTYVDERLIKGKQAPSNVIDSQIDSELAKLSKGKQISPSRKTLTDNDKSLARVYGGKPKGGVLIKYSNQPTRITKEKAKELFPSLVVEDNAKKKLEEITEILHKNKNTTSYTKNLSNEELQIRLDKLKKEHFKDMDFENMDDLNMDILVDDFDNQRQLEYYEKIMQGNQNDSQYSNMFRDNLLTSKMISRDSLFINGKPPTHTTSNFYQGRIPFQSVDILPHRDGSRISSSKVDKSRLENRSKINQTSGLRKIYGNLGELVVPSEKREYERSGRIQSPGSTLTLRSGFSRQPTQSRFDYNAAA
jgi:hypothetical protein